jgi:hypothetical protein
MRAICRMAARGVTIDVPFSHGDCVAGTTSSGRDQRDRHREDRRLRRGKAQRQREGEEGYSDRRAEAKTGAHYQQPVRPLPPQSSGRADNENHQYLRRYGFDEPDRAEYARIDMEKGDERGKCRNVEQ